MVDQDEIDEDIFADLYTDTEKPPTRPAPAVKIEEPSPVAFGSVDAAPAVNTEPVADSKDNYQHGQFGGSANPNDSHMQGSDWNGNGNQAYDAQQPVEQEDNYGPINVKEDGKMFIGGLNWETTEDSLKDYFSQFGEVSECTVMRDSATGRSRGFGFLTFKDPKCVNIVMVKEHYLDGKIIDPKRAIPREEQERTSKIFVGGVSQEATEQDFKDFFKQFGRVVDATLMMDKDTGRPRGFGFVTFDGDAAVDLTLQGPLQILGKPIEVKRAQPRGNLRDGEDDKKFGRGGGKFGGRNDNQQPSFDQQPQNPNGGNNQMSPAMMAQYWQRMQQYFSVMQQTIASQHGMQPNPMAAMGGQMNPAMMQPMMAAMQQAGGNRPQMGSPQPTGPNNMGQMNPAMMQQMQQMGQMAQVGMSPQQQAGYGSPGSAAGNGSKPGYTAQEQLAFEQQKYEQQQQRRMQQSAGYGGQGGVTSWDGMYDEMPQPPMPPQGPASTRMNQGYGRGGGGGPHARGRQGSSQPPVQPSNAPANAPTGPKNAGKPGANYRGGGRAHRGGGFHPYHRG